MQFDFNSGNGICFLSAVDTMAPMGPGELSRLRRILLHPELKGMVVRFSPPAQECPRVPVAPQSLWNLLAWATVPIVATIHGPCQEGAAELALACHFRMASENASFRVAVLSSTCLAALAQRNVLRRSLIDLLLSDCAVCAEEALASGLVDRVVPARELDTAAQFYLESLIGNRPPNVIRAVMESIHNACQLPREEALRKEAALFLKVAREAFEADEAKAL